MAGILAGKARFSLAHGLLAALGCSEVVTTNYDRLYETAAAGVARDGKVASLPFDQATAGTPWVLKMHGDVVHPTSIVLTRTDFVRYDALSKPLGAILQSLMATKHVLVVGTSMTDDNFLRLAYEVLEFRKQGDDARGGESAPIGTVVALGSRICWMCGSRTCWGLRLSGRLPLRRGSCWLRSRRCLVGMVRVAVHGAGWCGGWRSWGRGLAVRRLNSDLRAVLCVHDVQDVREGASRVKGGASSAGSPANRCATTGRMSWCLWTGGSCEIASGGWTGPPMGQACGRRSCVISST